MASAVAHQIGYGRGVELIVIEGEVIEVVCLVSAGVHVPGIAQVFAV